MDKNGKVTFGKWNTGMAKHPLYGFGRLQNVEVFENKGIAKLKNRLVLDSSITPDQLPIAEVRDIYGNVYTLTGETGSGKCYKNGTVIQSGLNNAWDMAIYKNYLWVRHANVMSCYGPLDNAPSWFGNVGTGFEQYYNGKLLVGQDDFLYSGNGNSVAKIEVLTSGTPAVAPTITNTLNALDLPDGQYITTLVEYGKNIVMGTQGGSAYVDRGNHATARLYSWNRQAGTLGNPGLADLPVVFSENGVNAIFQHANKLYVQAGTQGNVYITDSTNYQQIAILPYTQNGILSNSIVYANAICVSARGTLLIGLSGYADGYSKAGIYEIDIADPAYPVVFRTISTQSTGATTVLKIGYIKSISYQQMNVGWSDGATYGVDNSDFRMYQSYGGIIETDMVKVGTFNDKHSFEHIEWCLAEPLVARQNIRISYRLNNKDDYTLIGTWGVTAGTGITEVGDNKISFEDIGAIADAEYVQLKIELDQATNAVYGSNINLINVAIW